jgi:pimeloyl-ACP methyl ester carboxylesterase
VAPRIPIVLLPGLDGTEILFEPFVAALPAWTAPRVVTYPQSGPTSYADVLERVVQAVADLETFVVLGWSFGGPLALQLARRRPRAVRGVVLASTFVRPPRPGLVAWRPAVTTPTVFAVRAPWRTRLFLPGLASAEFRSAKRRTWRAVGAAPLAARARAVLGVDARADLLACEAPLLCLAGAADRVVPQCNVDELRAAVPTLEVHILEGGHMALFTDAVAAAARASEFAVRCWAREP